MPRIPAVFFTLTFCVACTDEPSFREPPPDVAPPDADATVTDITLDAPADTTNDLEAARAPDATNAMDAPASDAHTQTDKPPEAVAMCPSRCDTPSDCAPCYAPGETGNYCCMSNLCIFTPGTCPDAGPPTDVSPPPTDTPPTPDVGMPAPTGDGGVCALPCAGSCEGICVQLVGALPLCSRSCADNRGCAADERCVEFSRLSAPNTLGAVCVPRAGLQACPGSSAHCDRFMFSSSCRSGNVVREVPLYPACGAEIEYCPNGCVGSAMDGGLTSAGCLP